MAAGSSAWRRVVEPCPLTWHSVLVAAPAATPILCRRNAAVPRVARQWVRPRSSAMSIDVALSTRRGVGRDTYSLPKKNAAAPRTVCHNGQSAALLSSSGLVMYFSTLPAPSSSAPCILTILPHLRVCVKICILTHPLLSCAPGAMSTDFVFVTWIHSRCEEATTRFEAQDG